MKISELNSIKINHIPFQLDMVSERAPKKLIGYEKKMLF